MNAENIKLRAGLRVLNGKLTRGNIETLFKETAKELGVLRAVFREVRTKCDLDGVIVRWSLWVGKYDHTPAWNNELVDKRHAYVLVLEHNDWVGVSSSMAGNPAGRISLTKPSYGQLCCVGSSDTSEYGQVASRALRTGGVGVSRTSVSGVNLESTLARSGTNRSVPTRLRLSDDNNQEWAITMGSGRVGNVGSSGSIADLCQFFIKVISELESGSRSAFMQAFSQPVDFGDAMKELVPQYLQFDLGVLEERSAEGWIFSKNDEVLSEDKFSELKKQFETSWELQPIGDDEKRWKITSEDTEIGQLKLGSNKFSLLSIFFDKIKTTSPNGDQSSLKTWFNGGGVKFVVSFSNPDYLYYDHQLFHDDKLVAGSQQLADLLEDILPNNVVGEKENDGLDFDLKSLFGIVENQLAAGSQFIICEDLSAEWADYVVLENNRVTFYHCKASDVTMGASGLHDVVSQAIKNMGLLRASKTDLEGRKAKWNDKWYKTEIDRNRTANPIDDFITEFVSAVAKPNYRPCVAIVISGLSKKRVGDAFEKLRNGDKTPTHYGQVLWLLIFFIDSCRTAGAEARIICQE